MCVKSIVAYCFCQFFEILALIFLRLIDSITKLFQIVVRHVKFELKSYHLEHLALSHAYLIHQLILLYVGHGPEQLTFTFLRFLNEHLPLILFLWYTINRSVSFFL